MLTIKLVRHGESDANLGKVTSQEIGDHAISLSDHGHEQAREAGRAIGRQWLAGALVYCSPYRRTRETLAALLDGARDEEDDDLRSAIRVYEDPRLREVEHRRLTGQD